MLYRQQFEIFDPVPLELLEPGLFEPLEGFLGEHVEPLGLLVKRLSLGEFVQVFPDGDNLEDQFYDHQPEVFEVLDDFDELNSTRVRNKSRSAEVHDSGVAPQGDPSIKPGGDNAGDQETSSDLEVLL